MKKETKLILIKIRNILFVIGCIAFVTQLIPNSDSTILFYGLTNNSNCIGLEVLIGVC